MNTQVDFELAKLLNKKGIYISSGKRYNRKGTFEYSKSWSVAAPTVAEVIMWLYEKYGIWIWVEHYETDSKFIPQIPKANLPKVLGFYNSPTEAYEAAIKYSLENIK